MQIKIFDVETGPLPKSDLEKLRPDFDDAVVKIGNLKDEEKIKAKREEARLNYFRDFFEKAALDPLTGRVLAIGVMTFESHGGGRPSFAEPGQFNLIGYEDEAQMIREFWDNVRGEMGRINPLIGFNIFSFDLPFLIRRSWKHGVPVPSGLRRGRYWNDQLIDLRDCWQLGDRQARGSLDSIARHLGVGAKTGEGQAFAELWQTNRPQAEAYLRNDVELTTLVASKLGFTA